jgi:CBS domain-containing protein
MEVGKLITKPFTLSPYTSVADVIELMSKKKLREVVLIEDGKLVGMVTLRLLIGPGIQKDLDVSNFAFMPPVVAPGEEVSRAIYELVDIGLESIPVMEHLDFKGIINSKEILLNSQLIGRVKDIMVGAITVNSDDPVSKARAIMTINHINRLPVLNKGKLVGIITSSDVARRVFLSKYGRYHGHQVGEPDLDQPVEKFMTSQIITVGPDNKLEDAKKIMLEYDLRALPVLVGDRLVGILCRLDILKKLAPKVSGIRIYFSGLEELEDDLTAAIEKYVKTAVNELAVTGKIDRVEIALKRHSESVYTVKIKAGELTEELKGKDVLLSVKQAFTKILKKAGLK